LSNPKVAAMAPPEGERGWRGAVARMAAWTGASPRRLRLVQVGAAALAFEGFALMAVAPKIVVQNPAFFWVGAAFVAVGAFLLLLPTLQRSLSGAPAKVAMPAGKKRPAPAEPTLADRLIERVTLNGRLNRLFPLFGAAVVAFDLLYNAFLTSSPRLLSNDFAVLGLGAALIAFPFFPKDFERERNFVLLFFGALALIFGVPLLALRLGHDASGSVDEYTATLVTPQLAAILNAIGNPVSYIGNDVFYMDLSSGRAAAVHIATQCSGLYSMAIFIAAFCALVVTDYPKLTRRVGALLAAGVVLAYLANLLRMVVIVEAGQHYGSGALLWTHANLGDIIFLAWVAPFMWLAYRVLDPREMGAAQEEADREAFREGLRAKGVDPDHVTEDDWFCGSCYARVDAPGGKGPPACPSCGAAL
jgi:archaeosortase C (PEF-CTERM variant)